MARGVKPGRAGGVSWALLTWALAAPSASWAQAPPKPGEPVTNNPYYAAPGNYGTSWGTASYGMVRTWSEFSSPYGGGYGLGYRPSTFLPGPHGVGLWASSGANTRALHGGHERYATFAVPFGRAPADLPPPPPIGVYAPALGPTFLGW